MHLCFVNQYCQIIFLFVLYIKNLLISKCSYKDTSRVSSIPQLTGQHRWHTLVALPGQHNLVRRDLYGLRPTPLGQSNAKFPTRRYSQESEEQSQQNSPRRPLVVPNLRRPPIPPPYPRQGCQRFFRLNVKSSLQPCQLIMLQICSKILKFSNFKKINNFNSVKRMYCYISLATVEVFQLESFKLGNFSAS